MYNLCLDTCTWIYLANGTEPVKFLDFIANEVEKNNIKIILPEIIIDEWNRNKDDTVNKGTIIHFSQIIEGLERVKRLLGQKGKRPIQPVSSQHFPEQGSFCHTTQHVYFLFILI